MMRLLGSGLILIGSFGMAARYALRLRWEMETLEELSTILERIESEIRYDRASLPECFWKIGAQRRTRLGRSFEKLGKDAIHASEGSLREALEAELREEIEPLLSLEDYRTLFDFVTPGGFAGDEMQRRALERSRHRVDEVLEQRRKEYQGKRKVAVSMGLMGGLCIILFLW